MIKAVCTFFASFLLILLIIIGSSSGSSTITEASILFGTDGTELSLFNKVYYPAIIEVYQENKVLVPLSWMWAIGFHVTATENTVENVKKWAELTAYKPEYYRIQTDIDEDGNEYSWEELIPEDELGCEDEKACDAKGYIKKYVLVSKEDFAMNVQNKLGNGSLPSYFYEIAIQFEEADNILFGEFDFNDPSSGEDLEGIWDQEITLPFENYAITCEYGCYPGHNAIDLQPVPRTIATNHHMQAGCAGTISQNAYDSMGGNYVTIQCSESNLQLYYGHMISKSSYGLGSTISKGDIIGYVGSTGYVTGPHVHWKFMINGKAVNPRLIFEFK